MPVATPDELVYDEAVRVIERQRVTASELRAGASLLIATAAIAIALLDESASAPFAWLALAAFLVVSLSALAVIWPRRQLLEAPRLATHVSNLTGELPMATAELQREFITSMAVRQQTMAQYTLSLSRAFRVGASALIVQLAATVAARILGA